MVVGEKRERGRMLFFTIVLLVLFLDQLAKHLVVSFLELGQSVPVLGETVSITYVLNPGAAWGILAHRTTFFVVITLIVALVILYYNHCLPACYKFTRIGLAFQLGGAVGNLVDRIRVGHVIDFLKISFYPPIFNLADAAIVIGGIIFIFSLWKESRRTRLTNP